MIDTNVHLFRWPFRRLSADDPDSLVRSLRAKGVTQAWAGSFEALLCRDVAGLNQRLADACRVAGPGFLLPFGCVNPELPDWEEDLRRCHQVHCMSGIRLYPNYHGYTLANARCAKLLSMAAERKLIVQIALSIEDTRTQFPRMLVPPVDPAPLADLLARLPHLRLMLLNQGGWAEEDASPAILKIRQAGNVYFDISMDEGVGGLDRLVAAISSARVVFGSHFPLFYFESAWLKVQSSDLSAVQKQALLEQNALALLRPHA